MKLISLFLIMFSFSATSAQAQEVCFDKYRVFGFSSATMNSLIVDARSERYLVKVFPCWELPYTNRIDFDTRGFRRVCKWDEVMVFDRFDNRVIEKCTIESITKI